VSISTIIYHYHFDDDDDDDDDNDDDDNDHDDDEWVIFLDHSNHTFFEKNINAWPFQSTVSHFGRTRIQRLQAATAPEISVPLRLSKCLGDSTPLSKHFRSLGPLGWEQPSPL
jgi:hypothetical protein